MGLLCFVLDLPSFQPFLFKDIKQSLLQLANLCAIRKFKRPPSSVARSINLAVCCIDRSSVSGDYELHVNHKPTDSLNLRDFHHVVTSLPPSSAADSRSGSFGCGQVSILAALLKEHDGILSWGPQHICKKVVMISGHFMEDIASFREILLEAADHCIAIDFIQIKQLDADQNAQENSSHIEALQLNCLPEFAVSIAEFDNCTFQQVSWDPWLFASLVKQWIQDIVNDVEGHMEVTLCFQETLYEDRDKVFCSFFPTLMQIADTMQPCQTCRCHGAVLDPGVRVGPGVKKDFCPLTGQELDTHDLACNGIKIGSETVLYLPSFKSPLEPPKVYINPRPSLAFTVIKAVALATLSEGLLFGNPHIVAPSSEIDMDGDEGDLEKNDGIFATLCDALHSQDCGLLCTSTSDIDSMMETSFPCYYLLLPAQNGSLLAKKIATSEELLTAPHAIKHSDAPVHMKDSVYSCLSKIGIENYNPLAHKRGCHAKLSWLAKESLQFRPLPGQKLQISKVSEDRQVQLPSKKPSNCINDSSYPGSVDTRSGMDLGEDGLLCPPEKQTFSCLGRFSGIKALNIAEVQSNHKCCSPAPAHSKMSLVNSSPLAAGRNTLVMHGSGTCLSQQAKKPLLPLQSCPRPSQKQMMTSSSCYPQPVKQMEARKLNPEPQLKANFRRIKQGKL